jgi:hypothetical protein
VNIVSTKLSVNPSAEANTILSIDLPWSQGPPRIPTIDQYALVFENCPIAVE